MVPKTQATTLPEYDAMAEAEQARRSKIAAANPIAARSVVWPMSQQGAPNRPQPAAGAAATKPKPGAKAGSIPVQPASAPTPAAAASPAPSPQAAPEEPEPKSSLR